MSFPCPLPPPAPDRNTLQSFQVRERHPPTSVLPIRLVAHAPFLLGWKRAQDTAIPPGNRRRYDKKRRFVMNRR